MKLGFSLPSFSFLPGQHAAGHTSILPALGLTSADLTGVRGAEVELGGCRVELLLAQREVTCLGPEE